MTSSALNLEFGNNVLKLAQQLAAEGKDPNQIANIVFQKDPNGYNYGIGIILDGKGQPMGTSSVLLSQAAKEIESSTKGTYLNSAALMAALKTEVMKWQRIPESLADDFILSTPSDAGTGAVITALHAAFLIHPDLTTIGIEKRGWPAYKTIAHVLRQGIKEFDSEDLKGNKDLIPIFQSGPMNSTGKVPGLDLINQRAAAAATQKQFIILDRAYSGFEYAHSIAIENYDTLMRRSFENQIKPFIDLGVPFFLAVSPTKAFVTFSLRPCGFLLVYCPDASLRKKVTTSLNNIVRARGSSFEHPISRAFIKSMIDHRPQLENEHGQALRRIAEAEALWKKLSAGTPMETYFSSEYAGLFRNTQIKKEGAAALYNEHLYPVFSEDRCRLNVTGLPVKESSAQRHVELFSQYCS